MTTAENIKAIDFAADRFVNVYHESPNADFVLALRRSSSDYAALLSAVMKLAEKCARLSKRSDATKAYAAWNRRMAAELESVVGKERK